MSKLLKYIFIAFLLLGAHSAFAFTCTAVDATESWNVGASWTSCNSTFPQAGDDVVINMTAGHTLTVNVSTNNLKSFNMTGNAGTLAGSSIIQLSGSAASTQSIIFAGVITWTGTLTLNNAATANFNLTTNGKLLTNMAQNGASNSTTTLQDTLNFSAIKTDTLTFTTAGSVFDMNGQTIAGNSATNRILVTSATLGTAKIIKINSGSFTNADFRDINFDNGGSSLDLSAITGLSGDCGGNGMSGGGSLTLTSSQNHYWVGNTGNWSATGSWSTSSGGSSGARVPLPQDDVFFDNGSFNGVSQTATSDMPRDGRSIDWSAYSEAQTPIWGGGGIVHTVYGSVTLNSQLTDSISRSTTYESRTSSTLTSAGKTYISVATFAAFGGTYQLQDAFTLTSTLTLSNGTIDMNNFNLTATVMSAAGALTRTFSCGTGMATFTSTGNVWNFSGATNATVSCLSGTIALSNTTTTAKNFFGNGYTYGTVTFTGQNITVSGANTYTTLNLNTAGLPVATKFTAGVTQTTTNFATNGSVGNLVFASSTTASAATLTKAGGGTICVNYMNIQSITGTPGSTWFVGANSTDSTGNTGLSFTTCAASGGASDDDTNFFLLFN